MDYILTFLEGVASFISPCLLPMLPIYVSYFVGQDNKSIKKTLINSIGFVLGFTIVFLILAIFASTFGSFISSNLKIFKIIFGILIIVLGLNYMQVLKLGFLNKTKRFKINTENLNFFKAFAFGIMFSISWTPCIGAFLSSALMLVASRQDLVKGIILMLIYSVGLGIPFIISAVFIEKFKKMFDFIKKNFGKVKVISGLILIGMGIYMIAF